MRNKLRVRTIFIFLLRNSFEHKKTGAGLEAAPVLNLMNLLSFVYFLLTLYSLPSSVTAYNAPSFPSIIALKR